MKKTLVLLTVLVLSLPALVFSDSFIFRIGYFMPKVPQPDSLRAIEFDQMNFGAEDFRRAMYGIGYEKFLTKQLSIALTVDTYGRDKLGVYNEDEWVGYTLDVDGTDMDFAFPGDIYYGDFLIGHAFNVSITPIQLSLKIAPLGRRGRFVPYVGGGVGAYFWSVKLVGEIIDFSDPWIYPDNELGDIDIYPVVLTDARETGRVTIGYHALGGIQIPIGYRLTLDAEARYNMVKGKWKSDSAFVAFDDFDMSGLVVSLGFSYWF